MWRLALLLWMMGGTVLAGVLVVVVLLVPSLYAMSMRAIPVAAAIGAIVAIPMAFAAAKAIAGRAREAR